MNIEKLNEVIACLPRERTVFHYFKGQYAPLLLSYVLKEDTSVKTVKQSNFKTLLNQSEVKSLLSQQGSGVISAELFKHAWKDNSEAFILTIDQWGRNNSWHCQTTRRGSNLVLQLNFSEKHNRRYQKLLNPKLDAAFNYRSHPVLTKNKREFFRETLAWSRLDFDLDTGEALIEEIQSDWLKRITSTLTSLKAGKIDFALRNCQCKPEQFIHYVEEVLAPYYTLWAEAMLMATIQFLYKEVGLHTIYFHSYESGNKIKFSSGPRSLYSDLPRKFCFQLTKEDPLFLKNDRSFKKQRKKNTDIQWYQLQL